MPCKKSSHYLAPPSAPPSAPSIPPPCHARSDVWRVAALLPHVPHGCAGAGRALVAAAALGDVSCVRHLLDAGADPRHHDHAPLLAATRNDVNPQVGSGVWELDWSTLGSVDWDEDWKLLAWCCLTALRINAEGLGATLSFFRLTAIQIIKLLLKAGSDPAAGNGQGESVGAARSIFTPS